MGVRIPCLPLQRGVSTEISGLGSRDAGRTSCDVFVSVVSMKIRLQDKEGSSIAAMVAPEDLRRGDFVAVLSEIVELPSFLWTETIPSGRSELVRVRRLPTEDRAPLKVKAICLPFIFVKLPSGQFQTIDVRLANLVRLEKRYAKAVWKTLRTTPSKPGSAC
jgi:hypothetical protein